MNLSSNNTINLDYSTPIRLLTIAQKNYLCEKFIHTTQ